MKTIPIAAFLAAALAAGVIALPGIAVAQDLPSYAHPAPAQDETITGRIESVVDAFHITVRDDRGFVDNVQLHPGTIINPRGLTLEGGMSVTILGRNAGASFDANEIDTPYTYSGEVPPPLYYGAGWWYPGYDYGFGPAFGLGLAYGFGSTIIVIHEPYHGHPWNGQPYRWRMPPVGANPVPGRRYPLAGSAPRANAYAPGSRVITTAPAYRSAPAAQRAPSVERAAPARPAPAARSPHG